MRTEQINSNKNSNVKTSTYDSRAGRTESGRHDASLSGLDIESQQIEGALQQKAQSIDSFKDRSGSETKRHVEAKETDRDQNLEMKTGSKIDSQLNRKRDEPLKGVQQTPSDRQIDEKFEKPRIDAADSRRTGSPEMFPEITQTGRQFHVGQAASEMVHEPQAEATSVSDLVQTGISGGAIMKTVTGFDPAPGEEARERKDRNSLSDEKRQKQVRH